MAVQQPSTGMPGAETLFSISEVISQAHTWKAALDKVSPLVRSILIFDNLVLYGTNPDGEGLDVLYARAIGRGRTGEADIAWGEEMANRISRSLKTLLEEPPPDSDYSRLRNPFLLGVPLTIAKRFLGAMVLVRFGGPRFTAEQIRLAEFIGRQLSFLLERKRLENEHEVLVDKHRAIQLQEDFISTISHELRSPLGFIKGYTTTLLRHDTTWDPDTQHEFLHIIDQETDHLQELISNLLDSARLQSGVLEMKFQPLRLDALLGDLITRTTVHHPTTKITLQTSSQIVPFRGDPLRLSQVFENLISNTLKYAPGSEILIKIEQDARGVDVLFKDFGPGISPDLVPMIFNRFFRAPEQSVNSLGSGLGLFICKQIIDAHNGIIIAESDIGQGMVFHIHLPLDPDQPDTGKEVTS